MLPGLIEAHPIKKVDNKTQCREVMHAEHFEKS